MTCQNRTWHETSSHLRFVAVKRKQEVQSGQTLLGILVLLSCGVCETRNVQNGNCFGLFWDACVASVVDFGFCCYLDFRKKVGGSKNGARRGQERTGS